MKKCIHYLLFLSSLFSLSQENRDTFTGEAHIVHKVVFDDEAAFNQSAELFLRLSDSIVKKNYLNNPNSKNNSQYGSLEDRLTSNRLFGMIALDYDTGNNWRKPKTKRWIFTDSLVEIHNRYSNNPYLINRATATYLNRYKYEPSGKHILATYNFFNEPYKNIIVNKDDVKKFAGISCFKVLITYEDKRFNDIGDSHYETVYEMYVTDKIKSKYNPISADLNILRKYFPMYVKSYRTGIKGRYYESEIVLLSDYTDLEKEELKVSFEKLSDSLFNKYRAFLKLEENDKREDKEEGSIIFESKEFVLNKHLRTEKFKKKEYNRLKKFVEENIETENADDFIDSMPKSALEARADTLRCTHSLDIYKNRYESKVVCDDNQTFKINSYEVIDRNNLEVYTVLYDTINETLKKLPKRKARLYSVSNDYEITEYPKESKTIKGYQCFKVIMRKKSISNPHLTIYDFELYMTDEIKLNFNPVARYKEILEKYYPLEITKKPRNRKTAEVTIWKVKAVDLKK